MPTLSTNKIVPVVDLPSWEWTRPLQVAPTAGLSCSAMADNTDFNAISGRYIYTLLNATNFWRYDTISDTHMQLASPGITALTASSMRFAGALGVYGQTISATSTTLTAGLPFDGSCVGYNIRIISGKGSGQVRVITAATDPQVLDFGGVNSGTATTITDTLKAWTINNWVGYVVRVVGGTGINQVRKILYNTATVLTVADLNMYQQNTWCAPMQGGTAPTAGTLGMLSTAAGTGTTSTYQIESTTITVDTAWDEIPDDTSRFVIQSGGIFLLSGATVANGGVTLQYYSVLEDIWYAKSVNTNTVSTLLTDAALERCTENSNIWYTGKATSGTTTTLTDSGANWQVNQFAGYKLYIWSGTGRGQIANITSNTATILTFGTIATAPDSTSRYTIIGYDAGTLTSTEQRIIFDTTKTWTVNQYANYSVRILSGTGRGQTRQIMSNGSNSLVVYDNWNVQPDNTSVYVILGSPMDMFISLGANAQTYLYRVADNDILTGSRILDSGSLCVAAALLTDKVSTATQEIYEQPAIPITSLAGTTTITATTTQPHGLKTGQWVAIRGVTSGANDVFNVTGKVSITVTGTSTFTYTPFAAGSGTYQYSDNVTLGASVLPDASKFHADAATGGSTSTITFSRASPSNINGWYVYGTNVASGAQVQSGAGTTTITLNIAGGGTPTGTIRFTKWPRPETFAYSSGGGAGQFSFVGGSTIPVFTRGWLVTGTNIGVGTIQTGESTTTINLSNPIVTGAPSGTITLSHPCNNPLPVSRTYSSGSGASIVLSTAAPTYVRGWWVTGTNIANGTIVTGGEGTTTITLSNDTSGTPSGTITFYPPSCAPAVIYNTSSAPALSATGLLAASGGPMQLVAQNTNNGTVMTPLAAVGGAVAAVSRYVVTRRDLIAQYMEGQNLNYLTGISTGASTTTVVDNNAFWATATGSGGSTGTFSFTISAIGSPIHNGWYVSGTGIPAGSRVTKGGGTTTITIDTALTGAVSGTITFTAWPASLTGRRLRILSGTGINQDLAPTVAGFTPSTGTITFGTATSPQAGVSMYALLPPTVPSTNLNLQWVSDSSVPSFRGRYLLRPRGTQVGIDRIDLTTDRILPLYTTPISETFPLGTQYAYDQYDRLYINIGGTNRIMYLDIPYNRLQGAGLFPYAVGTAGIGNLMEVFKTTDGIKFLWVNRKANVECFRQLLFY